MHALDVELPTLELEKLERMAVIAAMQRTGGRVQAAAGLLGLSRHALSRRLVHHGIRLGPQASDRSVEVTGAAQCRRCRRMRTSIARRGWPCQCGDDARTVARDQASVAAE